MRWLIPTLFGADEDPPKEKDPEEGPPKVPEEKKGDDSRTLTSEELDKIAARAADRAARKAAKDLAVELGFENATALKDWAKEHKAAEEEAKDEAQKAKEKQDQEAAQQAADRVALQADKRKVAVQRSVLNSGVGDPKKSSRIATLVESELDSDIEEEEWEKAIEDALAEVKKDTPELFAASSHGSGDGGAGGPSAPADAVKEQEKKLKEEYEAKGYVEAPTP